MDLSDYMDWIKIDSNGNLRITDFTIARKVRIRVIATAKSVWSEQFIVILEIKPCGIDQFSLGYANIQLTSTEELIARKANNDTELTFQIEGIVN